MNDFVAWGAIGSLESYPLPSLTTTAKAYLSSSDIGRQIMVQIAAISENVTLSSLRHKFNLEQSYDRQFFPECYDDLPQLTDLDKYSLDRIKDWYLYQTESGPLSEETVKMTVVSPLLNLAGFYQRPFQLRTEAPVELSVMDRDEVLKGRIDALVVRDQFWVLVIEAKRTGFSVPVAIPQALTYMLSSPHPDRPTFGLLTSGDDFLFIKLVKQQKPQFALSNKFTLFSYDNELYEVLSVVKRIGELIT